MKKEPDSVLNDKHQFASNCIYDTIYEMDHLTNKVNNTKVQRGHPQNISTELNQLPNYTRNERM